MTETAGQRLALRQVTEIEAANPIALEVIGTQQGDGDETLWIEVSLNLAGVAHAPGGIRVRERERFYLVVDRTFPYRPPSVSVAHRRWAGAAHVQWGQILCLYAAPSVEWLPGDGMRGLIDRLLLWVEKAAVGQLDPDDRPRHPPVAYTGSAGEQILVRADLADRVPWAQDPSPKVAYLVARCEQRGDRLDVTGWQTSAEFTRAVDAGAWTDANQGHATVAVAAVLIDAEIGFEYPARADALAAGLRAAGVAYESFMELIAQVAAANAVNAGAA